MSGKLDSYVFVYWFAWQDIFTCSVMRLPWGYGALHAANLNGRADGNDPQLKDIYDKLIWKSHYDVNKKIVSFFRSLFW